MPKKDSGGFYHTNYWEGKYKSAEWEWYAEIYECHREKNV